VEERDLSGALIEVREEQDRPRLLVADPRDALPRDPPQVVERALLDREVAMKTTGSDIGPPPGPS
jgi:hypothetical protein